MHLGEFQHWSATTEWDGTVLLEINKHESSANSFSEPLLAELLQILHKLSAARVPGLVIYSKKSSGFSVGADVTGFQAANNIMDLIEQGQHVYQVLSQCPFPSVAAIHGFCLGGGCELALACKYRVATSDVQIGLPEVRLGIHPGWGGTARLPDLVGAHNALQLMIQGKPIKSRAAVAMGLVDSIVSAESLVTEARMLLYSAPRRSLLQQTLVWTSNTWPVRQLFAEFLLWQTRAKVNETHYPAPFQIIKLWRNYGTFDERIANEAASIYSLSHHETSKNLISIFLLQESLKHGDKTGHGLRHLHIMGSTLLAGDLAALCATKEFRVTTSDDVSVHSNRFFARKHASADVRARLVHDPNGLESADAVIEALPEVLEQKQQLFREISPKVKHDALLISTTGVFSLDKISAGLDEEVLGINFINPVGVVPLVQVPQSYEVSRLVSFARALGKLPIVVKPRAGLLINRILTPYIFEALYMYEEGIPASSIDAAAKKFGMPIGPLEYLDTVGLDAWSHYAAEIAPILNLRIPKTLVNPTQRGKADKQGIYTWEHDKIVNKPEATHIPAERLMFSLVCSALSASNLKIAETPELVDGATVFGTGFAPFLGGPINYSKSRPDFDQVVESLRSEYGPRFDTKSADYFKLTDV